MARLPATAGQPHRQPRHATRINPGGVQRAIPAHTPAARRPRRDPDGRQSPKRRPRHRRPQPRECSGQNRRNGQAEPSNIVTAVNNSYCAVRTTSQSRSLIASWTPKCSSGAGRHWPAWTFKQRARTESAHRRRTRHQAFTIRWAVPNETSSPNKTGSIWRPSPGAGGPTCSSVVAPRVS